MTRPLDSATATGFDGPVLPLATIIRLDIVGDPVYCWTGLGDLVFAPGATGDTALDNNTFLGIGTAIEIGSIADGVGGSDVLELSLAGVSLSDPMLRQLIVNKNRWQFKPAYVWMILLNPDTGAIVGKPFRIKTGRIDQMPYDEDKGKGVVKCRIEGQQSYGKQPLATRYSEQKDINSADISQNWVYSLANMTAEFGKPSAAPNIYSGYGNGGGGYDFRGIRSTRMM
jgi:hypothetical protein